MTSIAAQLESECGGLIDALEILVEAVARHENVTRTSVIADVVSSRTWQRHRRGQTQIDEHAFRRYQKRLCKHPDEFAALEAHWAGYVRPVMPLYRAGAVSFSARARKSYADNLVNEFGSHSSLQRALKDRTEFDALLQKLMCSPRTRGTPQLALRNGAALIALLDENSAIPAFDKEHSVLFVLQHMLYITYQHMDLQLHSELRAFIANLRNPDAVAHRGFLDGLFASRAQLKFERREPGPANQSLLLRVASAVHHLPTEMGEFIDMGSQTDPHLIVLGDLVRNSVYAKAIDHKALQSIVAEYEARVRSTSFSALDQWLFVRADLVRAQLALGNLKIADSLMAEINWEIKKAPPLESYASAAYVLLEGEYFASLAKSGESGLWDSAEKDLRQAAQSFLGQNDRFAAARARSLMKV